MNEFHINRINDSLHFLLYISSFCIPKLVNYWYKKTILHSDINIVNLKNWVCFDFEYFALTLSAEMNSKTTNKNSFSFKKKIQDKK